MAFAVAHSIHSSDAFPTAFIAAIDDTLEILNPYWLASFADDPENPAIPLIRYMIALTRCPLDQVEDLLNMARGKYVDELDIPASDVEEDFEEEYEEEDE